MVLPTTPLKWPRLLVQSKHELSGTHVTGIVVLMVIVRTEKQGDDWMGGGNEAI